jgi:hypothetical protein
MRFMRSPFCLYVCFLPYFVRQRHGKHNPEATNRHATIEELLGTVFSVRSVSYQVLNIVT